MPYQIISQDESTPMMPRSPYAATKVAQDRLAYAHAIAYDMNLVILRPCNVYGPWQRYGGFGAVIPTFVRNALRREPLCITGGGKQSREFIYVDDLVTAYLTVLDAPTVTPGEAYNVGTGETRTIHDIAVAIAGAIAHSGRIEYSAARVADVSGFLLDSKKFRSFFGWAPIVSFKDGLVDYLDWVRSRDGEG
jgi:UDP-glucose 4-epimerase